MKSMKKFMLLVALLVFFGQCSNNFKGYDRLSTISGSSDPQFCYLTLQIDNITSNATNFGQTGNLPNSCQFQNLNFNSLFRGDQVNDAVAFNSPVNGSSSASLNAAALQRNNGTACVYLYQTQYAYDLYVCHFTFSSIRIFLQIYGHNNFTFTSGISGLIIPNYVNGVNVSNTSNLISVNSSFPSITVNLSSDCNSTFNNVTNLASAITLQSSVNLTAYLPNMQLAYTIVRKANSFTPGDYRSIKRDSTAVLFGNATTSSCYTLPIAYSDILTDLTYCSEDVGCKVSFVLTNQAGDFYLLQTNGVVTGPTVGSNVTGNGTGIGNGTGVGNGTGNGTGVVSSGMAMALNVVAILLAIVYLA